MSVFPINDTQRNYIANGIFRAVSIDMAEVISENELPTTLGSGLFRWNFINKALSDSNCNEFEVAIQPRGSWKLLLLRDRRTSLTFSIMTEGNFKRIQRSCEAKKHYIHALVSVNKQRNEIDGQMSLWGQGTPNESAELTILRNELMACFGSELNEHILILFDCIYGEVSSVRAALLNPQLVVVYSEDWSSFLKKTYIPDNSVLGAILDDEDEQLASLKAEYSRRRDCDSEPALHNEKNEETEENA